MEARPHLVLLPFLAHGHLIPFLSLARLLERRKRAGAAVTIVSTPLNVAKLRSSLPPESAIRLAELPFSCSSHGLPPGCENMERLPLHLCASFFLATESLQPSFELFLSGLIQEEGHRGKLCIVGDVLFGWSVESAKKLGVYHSLLNTGGAYGWGVMYALWLRPPAVPPATDGDCDHEVALVGFPEVRIHSSQIANTLASPDGSDPIASFARRQLSLAFHSNGILVNTVEDLEKEGLRLLSRVSGLPTWPVGPLISSPAATCRGDVNGCMAFLETKPPASVLYISFGSQNTVPGPQMVELARGLEAAGRPFILVIRPPLELETEEELRDQGWPARAKEQGYLVQGWAPQLEILSHPSTGAFLSHCGWNSVLESLSNGVPLVGWPLGVDQLFNSRMLEEMGVCVEVARGRFFGGLRSGGGWKAVKEAVEMVLGGAERGREMRRKVEEVRERMKAALEDDGEIAGFSSKAMDAFLGAAFSN